MNRRSAIVGGLTGLLGISFPFINKKNNLFKLCCKDKTEYYIEIKDEKNFFVLHRKDGPAIEYANGTKEWWKEGVRHREDGPAIEYADGIKEWYKEGI